MRRLLVTLVPVGPIRSSLRPQAAPLGSMKSIIAIQAALGNARFTKVAVLPESVNGAVDGSSTGT